MHTACTPKLLHQYKVDHLLAVLCKQEELEDVTEVKILYESFAIVACSTFKSQLANRKAIAASKDAACDSPTLGRAIQNFSRHGGLTRLSGHSTPPLFSNNTYRPDELMDSVRGTAA